MMIEIHKNSDYMKPTILVKHENSEILTTNSLLLIKGEVGSGKSRLLMNLMTGLSGFNESLNFEYSKCPDDLHVVYISTEMTPYHLQRRLLKILSLTGFDYSKNIKFIDISDSNDFRKDIVSILSYYKPYVLIIDQIGDLVSNINDLEKTNQLYKFIKDVIHYYNCSVVAVVHQNEDSGINTKARGHLGSMLEQKAICSIAIANTTKGFKIKTTKMREGVNFNIDAEFDIQTEMLKKVEIPSSEIVVNMITYPVTSTDLIEHYKLLYNKSETYVRKIIKQQLKEGILITEKKGKEVFYNKSS